MALLIIYSDRSAPLREPAFDAARDRRALGRARSFLSVSPHRATTHRVGAKRELNASRGSLYGFSDG